MDILKTSENIRGVYFNYSQGQPFNLWGKEEKDTWKFTEYDLDNNETGKWEVKIQGNQLTGLWLQQNKKLNVNLRENYSSGLKLKNVEMKDEYQASKNYGIKNYLNLFRNKFNKFCFNV
jgi:V8-like Glu-specific endopeptidase